MKRSLENTLVEWLDADVPAFSIRSPRFQRCTNPDHGGRLNTFGTLCTKGNLPMRPTIILLTAICAATAALSANADMTVDEQTFGDFNAGQVFSLDPGDNLFIGSHGFTGSDPFDGFRFVVPNGYSTTIHFDYSFPGLPSTDSMAWVWTLSSLPDATPCTPTTWAYECALPTDSTLLAGQIFQTPADYVPYPSGWTLPPLQGLSVGPGVYLLTDNNGFSDTQAADASFAYTIDLATRPVPAPATGWLFAVALAVTISVRGRNQGQRSEDSIVRG